MSVQKYETDVLQEHVDSTAILIQRLDQWRKALELVSQYIVGYEHIHAGITAHLEKTLKNITEFPSFSQLQDQREPPKGTPENPADATLSNVFVNMQSSVNALLQRSATTTNGIKTTVLPHLEQVQNDIEKHYKTLKVQGNKGIREIEKARETTQKFVEQLGKVTSSFGTRPLTNQEDPYIIHRRVDVAVQDQIAKENIQAEAALGIQRNFASLENSIMETVRQSLVSLANLNETFDDDERTMNANISKMFSDINMEQEWERFSTANSEHLVPSTNYQRDIAYVTYNNKNHASTRPLIQGPLQRKGTVLKSYNTGYYVLTPSGFLHQFKAADPSQDSAPELSLYLPECQISKSSQPGSYTFKIVGKDSLKMITTRHKFAFKTTSQHDLDQWFSALGRVTGNVVAVDEDDDDTQTTLPSPGSPRVGGEIPPAAAPTTAAPASADAAAAAAAALGQGPPTTQLGGTHL